MVNKNSYIRGAYLATKDGNRYSNGYLVKVDESECVILTDFGNCISMSLESVKEHFEPSDAWIDSSNVNYPHPSLYERIEEQISLLEHALDKVA